MNKKISLLLLLFGCFHASGSNGFLKKLLEKIENENNDHLNLHFIEPLNENKQDENKQNNTEVSVVKKPDPIQNSTPPQVEITAQKSLDTAPTAQDGLLKTTLYYAKKHLKTVDNNRNTLLNLKELRVKRPALFNTIENTEIARKIEDVITDEQLNNRFNTLDDSEKWYQRTIDDTQKRINRLEDEKKSLLRKIKNRLFDGISSMGRTAKKVLSPSTYYPSTWFLSSMKTMHQNINAGENNVRIREQNNQYAKQIKMYDNFLNSELHNMQKNDPTAINQDFISHNPLMQDQTKQHKAPDNLGPDLLQFLSTQKAVQDIENDPFYKSVKKFYEDKSISDDKKTYLIKKAIHAYLHTIETDPKELVINPLIKPKNYGFIIEKGIEQALPIALQYKDIINVLTEKAWEKIQSTANIREKLGQTPIIPEMMSELQFYIADEALKEFQNSQIIAYALKYLL